jgi:anti-sigma factor RsiW
MNNGHLTVEQMEALLSNPELRERSQHLQQCERCLEELESLHALMGDMRAAVIASSEVHRRLAVMPELSHRTPRALWSLVAAAALLCAAAPIALHHKPAHVAVVQPPVLQVEAAVSDDQLMSDVQEDLSSSVPQGLLPLTAKDAPTEATGATSSLKENE